jgi:hypothetical protein
MRSWLFLALGILAVLIGAVWTLQGLGHLGGSAMTGERLWAVVGPIVALVGLLLIVAALRSRRRVAPPSPQTPPD